MANVTIRDVAQAAGVSIATVSDVLRPESRFSYRAETIAQVHAAVARLGYRPHGAARLLRQQNSRLIGVAIDVYALSLSPLTRAVYEEIERRHYEPMLLEARQFKGRSGSAAFPSPAMLAGLLSVDLVMEGDVPLFYGELRQHLPVIALYPIRSRSIDCITTDRAGGIEMAVDHLVALGHRRIVLAQQPAPGVPTIEAKRRGWLRAVKKHRLSGKEAREVAIPSGPVRDVARAFASVFPTLRPRPTAVICGGDMVAVGILSELGNAGVPVPAELSIMAFGDSHFCAYTQPPLTTVAEPHHAIARAAVERLLEIIENPGDTAVLRPRLQVLPPELRVRQSTAPPTPLKR